MDQGFDEYFPIDQSSRAVMFAFQKERTCFSLSYEIPCVNCFLDATAGFNGGRNFLFGGQSSLCSWPTPQPSVSLAPSAVRTAAPSISPAPSVSPAPTETYWETCDGPYFDLLIEGSELIANNLGNAGPNFDDDPVLRYAEVTTTGEGRSVDLVVSVQDGSEYLVADNFEQYQGVWELFGQINVRDNSTAHLDFSFVDSETSAAVVLEKFYVTVFDVDQQRVDTRHREQLCVDDDQYDEYVLGDATSLEITTQNTRCDGSPGSTSTVFQSTRAGFECDNPTDPLELGKRPASSPVILFFIHASFLGTIACEDCNQCVDQGFDEFFPIDQSSQAVMFVFRTPRDGFSLSYYIP